MAPQQENKPASRFLAFWSSLPGVLTGVAAVLAAAATLGALFTGGDDDAGGAAPPGATGAEPSTVPGAADDCFREYFKGIEEYRLGTVEAGAYVDVLHESEPKAGLLGITFTDFGRPLGGMRFAFFPENMFFKIESFVDARCRAVEDYENPLGGDKHSWADSSVVRVRLDERHFDVTASGGGSIVRVSFVGFTP